MFLLSGLLLLCVPFIEFPEMAALEDDTSNDCTILTTDSGRLPAIVDLRAGLRVASGERKYRGPIFTSWPERLSPSEPNGGRQSRDLLLLDSVWRT